MLNGWALKGVCLDTVTWEKSGETLQWHRFEVDPSAEASTQKAAETDGLPEGDLTSLCGAGAVAPPWAVELVLELRKARAGAVQQAMDEVWRTWSKGGASSSSVTGICKEDPSDGSIARPLPQDSGSLAEQLDTHVAALQEVLQQATSAASAAPSCATSAAGQITPRQTTPRLTTPRTTTLQQVGLRPTSPRSARAEPIPGSGRPLLMARQASGGNASSSTVASRSVVHM